MTTSRKAKWSQQKVRSYMPNSKLQKPAFFKTTCLQRKNMKKIWTTSMVKRIFTSQMSILPGNLMNSVPTLATKSKQSLTRNRQSLRKIVTYPICMTPEKLTTPWKTKLSLVYKCLVPLDF
jgi:hypothetical protein